MTVTRLGWNHRRLQSVDYTSKEYAYFVTLRLRVGIVPIQNTALAEEFIESLLWLRAKERITLHAYCLLPDHLHAVLRLGPSGTSLGNESGAFKRFTARQSWKYGYTGALWQPRFYDHVVRKREDMGDIVGYVFDNPARHKLVDAETYAWRGCPDPW